MQQGDWIIVSPDVIGVPMPGSSFEGDAKMQAEQLARHYRGKRFFIAQLVAMVQEPLPDLQWSDGRPAGSGADSLKILTSSAPQNYERRADTYAETPLGTNQAKALRRE